MEAKMTKILVLGLTFAVILSLSFGCGCIGDAPTFGADVKVYQNYVLINSYTRESPVNSLLEETVWAKANVESGFWCGGVFDSITVIDNLISIYIMSEPLPEPTSEPLPEPTPEPIPEPKKVRVNIYIDGSFVGHRYDFIEHDGEEKYLKDLQREFEAECYVLYVDVTKTGNKVKVEVVLIPEPTPTPTPVVETIIPSNYYTSSCSLSPGISILDSLTNYEWATEYEAGGWDCSQMSAAMEQKLENCGYDAVIQMGDEHAWILINLPAGVVIRETQLDSYTTPTEGWYAYECTGRYFVTSDMDWDYTAKYEFEDIYAVENFYNNKNWPNFEGEWAWWIS